MGESIEEMAVLAEYLGGRHEAILRTWRDAIIADPALKSGGSLPPADLYDHLPALLANFERQLRNPPPHALEPLTTAAQQYAAAHGLQRWQQGYDLREVTRELGKLNETVIAELDAYYDVHPGLSHEAIATARRLWAVLCSAGIEESVGQYFLLQQQEAAGHVADLEAALAEIRELEQQRGDLWRQAAHDLRGNLGVVANATAGLTHGNLRDSARDEFVRILMRNVTSLHHLLDDVTSLARLQAGREERHDGVVDVGAILQELCEGIRPLAQQRRLFLRCDGPPAFAVEGDAVKIRRIAQNLILNAVKFTREGGISVHWGESDADDSRRWELRVVDTGPGFHTDSGTPLAQALEKVAAAAAPDAAAVAPDPAGAAKPVERLIEQLKATPDNAGEGIGLSIVKRLCDIVGASVAMQSEPAVGTSFRILFPRRYSS